MPKITRTLVGYKCAECGKTYSDVEHWPVPELVIGGDGRDCVKKIRVHVQTQYDYEYSYSESTLCLPCQRKLLLAYIDQLYPTNPPEPRTCETCKTTCPDPGAPCSCFTPRSTQSADVETVREALTRLAYPTIIRCKPARVINLDDALAASPGRRSDD